MHLCSKDSETEKLNYPDWNRRRYIVHDSAQRKKSATTNASIGLRKTFASSPELPFDLILLRRASAVISPICASVGTRGQAQPRLASSNVVAVSPRLHRLLVAERSFAGGEVRCWAETASGGGGRECQKPGLFPGYFLHTLMCGTFVIFDAAHRTRYLLLPTQSA